MNIDKADRRNHAQKKASLSCFAADALAADPVAQATLPHALPLGFQGVIFANGLT